MLYSNDTPKRSTEQAPPRDLKSPALSLQDNMLFLLGEFKNDLNDDLERAFVQASHDVFDCTQACFVHDVALRELTVCSEDQLLDVLVKECRLDKRRIRAILGTDAATWKEKRSDAFSRREAIKAKLSKMRGPGALPGVCLNHSDGCVSVVGSCRMCCSMLLLIGLTPSCVGLCCVDIKCL